MYGMCQVCRCARGVSVPGVYVCRECRCAGSVGVPRVMCMVC